jgi:hypothetical protein
MVLNVKEENWSRPGEWSLKASLHRVAPGEEELNANGAWKGFLLAKCN